MVKTIRRRLLGGSRKNRRTARRQVRRNRRHSRRVARRVSRRHGRRHSRKQSRRHSRRHSRSHRRRQRGGVTLNPDGSGYVGPVGPVGPGDYQEPDPEGRVVRGISDQKYDPNLPTSPLPPPGLWTQQNEEPSPQPGTL